ncbi:hypothetical protein SAMN04487950_1076 [Halogranum rubrum]|uniref:Uncharacterized protein n=1 Tax=Halogranum rubrum TaxID=553466 RepID=A0A1I4CE88_9EURY|nr:hypothetical protein [Halogranum rubrum]SFK78466.1 hypothetical protein SAMN04487950_1076 [Halogranum rubrum]
MSRVSTLAGLRLPRLAYATDVRRWAVVVAVELLLVAGYFGLTGAEPTTLRFVLYPFVWLNVGVWAVNRTRPPAASRRQRILAGCVASAYFLVLTYAAGLLAFGHSHPDAVGVTLTAASPGWGPLVAYTTPNLRLLFVPFRVVGYLALSYLVYVAVLDAAKAAVPGLLALVTCIGCSFPLVVAAVGGVAGGVTGGSAGVVTAVAAYSLDLSTVVFVLAVGLLYWRPVGRRRL